MVKVGFICEGKTDRVVLNSDDFKRILGDNKIKMVGIPVSADGKDKFTDKHIGDKIKSLVDDGAEHIIFVRDLDDSQNISTAKNYMTMNFEPKTKIIAVKAIESWFLADTAMLNKFFGTESIFIEFPEIEESPAEKLSNLRNEYKNKGISDKVTFARTYCGHGFSIENAANHPNCPSAKYFINKLKSLTDNQNSPIGG